MHRLSEKVMLNVEFFSQTQVFHQTHFTRVEHAKINRTVLHAGIFKSL